MFDHTSFSDVFVTEEGQLPYDRNLCQEIEAHRKHADGTLFIDRVLQALGIIRGEQNDFWTHFNQDKQLYPNTKFGASPAKAYPPKNETALRQLHRLICDTGMALHHKLTIFYYMLLDYDDMYNDVHVSENFASVSGMPANYQLFMKGLWYLDRQHYSVRPRSDTQTRVSRASIRSPGQYSQNADTICSSHSEPSSSSHIRR